MATRLIGKQPPKEVRTRLRAQHTVTASGAAAESARPEAEAITAAASKYDDMLRKIYYDVREGFGSIKDTKAAKDKTPQ